MHVHAFALMSAGVPSAPNPKPYILNARWCMQVYRGSHLGRDVAIKRVEYGVVIAKKVALLMLDHGLEQMVCKWNEWAPIIGREVAQSFRELGSLSVLSSPHLVQFLGAFVDDLGIGFVMEVCRVPGGCLALDGS